jgi:RimJ/RimL family protein N-acetyltransferase
VTAAEVQIPARPASAATDPDRWYALEELAGRLVRLRPLLLEDAAGYHDAAHSAAGGEEVFRRLAMPAPADLEEARAQVLAALAARARGQRLAYAQLEQSSGRFIGTTSFYDIDPSLRTLAIGHTWLGRAWWRTGHNTESKLLMLSHAFDALGAARVVWHTDILNVRSQEAIERLGAVREGVLRKHRIRPDGSWRDTVQYCMTDDDWPAAAQQLRARFRGPEGP